LPAEGGAGGESAPGRASVEAEVRVAFARYEEALRRHDIEALNNFFVVSPDTVRFGIDEQNYGFDAIAAYRRESAPVHPQRELQHIVIVSIGAGVACVSAEFTDPATVGIGRQTQTWVRTAAGWKIAMAHVSTTRSKF